jgi:hypothetical protein
MASIEDIRLLDMIKDVKSLYGLADGLVQLPLPEYVTINKKRYPIPQTAEELAANICYGQRLFLARKEDNDFGCIVRVMDGYFYSLVTKLLWDEDKALLFGKKVITCKVIELYPTAMHLINLVSEMITREQKLLHREPTAIERAAGIEKLNIYSELTSLDFLRDAMKCTVPEVLLTPYNECLVRFMLAKEIQDFQDRHYELLKADSETKSKYR